MKQKYFKIGFRIIFFLVIFLVIGCTKQLSSESEVIQISPDQLNQMLEQEDIFLVDVHIPEQGHINGTDLFIDYREIMNNLYKLPEKNKKIVFYCRSGSMSNKVSKQLIAAGYTNIYNLEGGRNAWVAEGYKADGVTS